MNKSELSDAAGLLPADNCGQQSAAGRSPAGALPAEVPLAEHRKEVERMLFQARCKRASLKLRNFYVLAMWLEKYESRLADYLRLLNEGQMRGAPAGNEKLSDRLERAGSGRILC